MSRIIQPMGTVVAQVLIEIDTKGTTAVKAHHVRIGGQKIPMKPLELTVVLSQLVTTSLQILNMPRKGNNAEQEAQNNHD